VLIKDIRNNKEFWTSESNISYAPAKDQNFDWKDHRAPVKHACFFQS